jgi:hypothetical protein
VETPRSESSSKRYLAKAKTAKTKQKSIKPETLLGNKMMQGIP